jgi:hypothetical protein
MWPDEQNVLTSDAMISKACYAPVNLNNVVLGRIENGQRM